MCHQLSYLSSCFNFSLKEQVQKVILGQRVRKVQGNSVRRVKGLIKCETRGQIGRKTREAPSR